MDFQPTKAIYLQIVDFVCEQILLKKWRVSEKILSVRELAINLQVNPNTIVRAYAFLENLQIITMQRGIGYFVTETAISHIIEFKKKEFLVVHLPQVFKSMDLLGINFSEIQQLYNQREKCNEN
ncbi:MAG: GntR family transcriptional regulator [Gammaproteobacteria bacterium]|nr:GntR family transcriptional regulator [Gammaproteobacteria bacterium]